jgi:hypothetical protein
MSLDSLPPHRYKSESIAVRAEPTRADGLGVLDAAASYLPASG